MPQDISWWCYLPCFSVPLLAGIGPVSSAPGPSRLPSSGQALVENTPVLGNKGGKINQRCTTPPIAQVGLPTFTVGIQPSRPTQSISAIDRLSRLAHRHQAHPSRPTYTAQLSYCCRILKSIRIASAAVLGNFPLNKCEPDLPGLTKHSDSGKDHMSTINGAHPLLSGHSSGQKGPASQQGTTSVP